MKIGIQEELLLLNFLNTFLYKIAEWQVTECESVWSKFLFLKITSQKEMIALDQLWIS